MLTAIFTRCSKEAIEPEIIQKKSPLSKKSSDLLERLETVQAEYTRLKLYEKFLPKTERSITWTPIWSNPLVQLVNDSVSYVFYPLKGTILREGKVETVVEQNTASYLIVKNESEFYKGFYYVPSALESQGKKIDFNLKDFTGKLLLTNLQTNKNFLIDYNNGNVSSSYKKLSLTVPNKIQSIPGSTSYWEQYCHTEMRYCHYISDGYNPCGGAYLSVYRDDCQWPQKLCGVDFMLVDYDEVNVCQDVWFPDPPTGPGDSGSGGGSGGELVLSPEDMENLTIEQDGAVKIPNPQKYIDCFSDGKTVAYYRLTIYIEQPLAGTNKQSNAVTAVPLGNLGLVVNGFKLNVGHTFVGFQKVNIDGTQVQQIMGFYPDGFGPISDQAIKDNGGHEYDVSYSVYPNSLEFASALAALKYDAANKKYNVFTYNCTDAALNWMNAAGANISNVSRGVFRNSPGDLGYHFQSVTGADLNGGSASNSKGPCQ